MVKRFIFILSVVAMFLSCDYRENVRLSARVDSLRYELESAQANAQTLQEVGFLIDSIDASRKLLQTRMVEGTSYDEYISRLASINEYVRASQKKIVELEKSMRKSAATATSYAATVKKLKSELEKNNREVLALQELVNNIQRDNQSLASAIGEKDVQLIQKAELIDQKQQELQTLEARIQELAQRSKLNEAEAYFIQAQQVEETARRTKFAPRKKKASWAQALELYRVSLFLGKEEAQPKIAQLEEKL
jgi:chromosome segregation ATPase